MQGKPAPQCSWTGVNEEESEAIVCGKPAQYFVEARDGHRFYSCAEHLSSAKARAETGKVGRVEHLHHPDPERHLEPLDAVEID